VSVIFTYLQRQAGEVNGQFNYHYEANIQEFCVSVVGVGSDSRKARQDAAKRLLHRLFSEKQPELLNSLSSSSPTHQPTASTSRDVVELDPIVAFHKKAIEMAEGGITALLDDDDEDFSEIDRILDPERTTAAEFEHFIETRFTRIPNSPASP
jgi:hypothetical protein